MNDPLIAFIQHMRDSGVGPADPSAVIGDDTRRRYRLDGDKAKTQNGSYSLRVEPDGFAFGWAMSFKEGITHAWHIKTSRKATDAERADQKARIAAAKAARTAEESKAHADAAAKAKAIWARASKTGSTAYLERKGSGLLGAKVWQGLVVVPMYAKAKMVGLQFIAADGAKRFLTDTAKEGAYFPIAGADTARLVICEGFATATAIHRATGLAVIAAFDAGNLKPVAVAMRAKYPDAEIIIGADNDRWTVKPDGTAWNPGIEKAQQAAVAIGGARVIAPQVGDDDPARRTDWDDVSATDGPDVVAQAFTVIEGEPDDMGGHDDRWERDHDPQPGADIDALEHIRPLGHNGGMYYFFPRESGQIVELTASAIGSMQSLYRLASPAFWDERYGDNGKASASKVALGASGHLMARCHEIGIYDASKTRGVGAWMDGNTPVFSSGKRLFWDGGSCLPQDYKSKCVYQSGPEVTAIDGIPLGNADAARLLDICRSLTWRNSQHGYILAGWLVLALVGGALRWRPHIVLTGEKGSGKSTIIEKVIKSVLGDLALEIDGGSTEPGLRAAIGISSRPVVMDEAESEGKRDQSNMDSIFMLARKSSSGAVIRNANGEYRVRSCFCFAAINPRIMKGADLDRNAVIELMRDVSDDAGERYVSFLSTVREVITPKFQAGLLARTFGGLTTLLENVEVFATALADGRGGQRFGDQYGSLIAGAYSLTSNRKLTLDEAREWCGKQDWSWSVQDNDMSDSDRLVSAMLSARVRYDDKGIMRESTVGRLIDRSLHGDGVESDSATAALGDHGIKADADTITVANTCPAMSGVLRDTQWAAGWRRQIMSLEGAMQIANPIRFSPSVRSRAVEIPIGSFMGPMDVRHIPPAMDFGDDPF